LGGKSKAAGLNADRRERFLRGDVFHCAPAGDTQYATVGLRIPEYADFDSVWVWRDLYPVGSEHPVGCAVNALDEDPAKRLGILARYKKRKGGETPEFWFKVITEKDIKRVNTFVDFLDGKDDDYTQSQVRRYIPH
jgi:hypothetical protein